MGDALPRPRAAEPRTKEVLFRLTARHHKILQSLAHLEGVTANELAHRVLLQRLEHAEQDPLVEADLLNREAYAERRQGKVTPITGATTKGPGQ